jgi:hypothetical protein
MRYEVLEMNCFIPLFRVPHEWKCMLYFHDSKSYFSFPSVQKARDAKYTDSHTTNNQFHSTHPNICAIKYLNMGLDNIAYAV